MQSEQDQPKPPPMERETTAIHPARLAWRGAGRETCEGDIHASYSADVIASNGRVRKPFTWKGDLYVCTSITGSALTGSGMSEHEAYRMVPMKLFTGTSKPTVKKPIRRKTPKRHGATRTASITAWRSSTAQKVSCSAGRRSGSHRKHRRIGLAVTLVSPCS